MRIISENIFLNKGNFSNSKEYKLILSELRQAITSVSWFERNQFIINPIRKGNGVVPIKLNFINQLINLDWKPEYRMSFANGMNPGPVDIIKFTQFGTFAVEWETGNISSSHRALNKIAVGIIQEAIIGGLLILPMKNLSQYLTDRIGNYEEIEPYFPLYENLLIKEGVIGVIGIDYDGLSENADLIPKGQDGNAHKSLIEG